jgi:signal transduction histidine kinase
VLKCSVCGKRRKQVKRFDDHPGIYICDKCIERLDAIHREVDDRIDTLDRAPHRSPMDSRALHESLLSFTDEEGRDSGIRFHHGVDVFQLPAPIALLMFYIAREGAMNAIEHAEPTDIWIDIAEDMSGDVVLRVRDNGTGYDVTAPVRDRSGIRMMHDRANVGGGTLSITSSRGEGTMITVRFPNPSR